MHHHSYWKFEKQHLLTEKVDGILTEISCCKWEMKYMNLEQRKTMKSLPLLTIMNASLLEHKISRKSMDRRKKNCLDLYSPNGLRKIP